MIIEDVRLEDLEQNSERSPYYYRTRVMKITTDRGAFLTHIWHVLEYHYQKLFLWN